MGTEGVPVVIAALHDPCLAEDTSRKSELRFLVAATDVQGSTPDGRALEDQILPVVALSEGVDLLIGKVRIEAIIDRLFVVEQRSEEHTSELQSLMRISYAVFCLKKKNNTNKQSTTYIHSYNIKKIY